MRILNTIKKILRGEPLDWHNPLPPVVGPDEDLAVCIRCSKPFVIWKKDIRTPFYCVGCQ